MSYWDVRVTQTYDPMYLTTRVQVECINMKPYYVKDGPPDKNVFMFQISLSDEFIVKAGFDVEYTLYKQFSAMIEKRTEIPMSDRLYICKMIAKGLEGLIDLPEKKPKKQITYTNVAKVNFDWKLTSNKSSMYDEFKTYLEAIKPIEYNTIYQDTTAQFYLDDAGNVHYKGNPFATTASTVLANDSKKLPGMEAMVFYPCECEHNGHHYNPNTQQIVYKKIPDKAKVWSIVQHLNDRDKWTREQIADWLDELHDSGQINIEFEVESIADEEIANLITAEGGE